MLPLSNPSLHAPSGLSPSRHWPLDRCCGLIVLLWLWFSYAAVFFLPPPTVVRLTQEDSFYENLTFGAFFLGFLVFLGLYLTQRLGNNFLVFKTRRNVFFLLLALLFLFCSGEEISWGQRLFHIPTAGVFNDNLQHENTVHNLPGFVYEYHDVSGQLVHEPGVLHRLLRGNNLIFFFCYFWLVVVPASSWFSGKMHRFWAELNVPIVPIWMGGLLIMNNGLLHLVRFCLPTNSEVTGIKILEIKECNLSVLFLATGLWFMVAKKRSNAAVSTASQHGPTCELPGSTRTHPSP